MTVRQIAYRLKSEGKAEVIRDANEVASAYRASYAQAEAGANAASSAAERQEQRYRRLAVAAREAERAEATQGRYNAALGVSRSDAPSARESAAVFMAQADAMDDVEKRARALRAIIDPLGSAQDRLNDELAEYNRLAAAGQISTKELAQAQLMARQRFDESALAIDRNSRGLTRLQVASRLNLGRQAADVVVTAGMGMNPAMIALQQGPQIMDALATSGFKARASMLLLGGALGIAAGAGIAAFAAWQDAEGQALRLERVTSGLGRTAGLQAAEVEAFAQASAEASGISVRSAREIAAAYLSTGRIGGEVLGDLIAMTKDYASFTGQDAEAATQDLAKAMVAPDKSARDMTRSFGLMDQATLDTIDSLMKQGDQLGAQKLLIEALDGAVSGHASRVGEIESAWDGVARAASNAWDWIGKALYQTRDEQIATLEQRLQRNSGAGANIGLRQQDERTLRRLVLARGIDELLESGRGDGAAENQAAQLEEDRKDKPPRRRAPDRSAEREARERLQRERREEDRDFMLDLEVARASGNVEYIRGLEDANAVLARQRQLIDDGMEAEKARTQALEEQDRLTAAREERDQRGLDALTRSLELEDARERGDLATVQALEDKERLTASIETYQNLGMGHSLATLAAEIELASVTTRRAELMDRIVKSSDDERRLRLAQLAGRTEEAAILEREARVERRAREIEDREKMDRGQGDVRARREINEELAAEAEGVRRQWIRGFVDDVRQSGWADAIANQLEDATDRWLDKLIDSLMDVDWSSIFNGGGGGGGGFGSVLSQLGSSLFGGQGIGRNAAGTDFWRGGLTWVGEAGKELIDLPRGSRVLEHGRSMQLATASAASAPPMSFTWAPVIHAEGAGPREVEALDRKIDELGESLRQQVPALMREALSRRSL
ncbi:MAG: phage tail length tape measure family protein [Brevundimonas sp.]|uniref:phage tail length tape measure family protein n=1 Tax=Brevundimonas sp. TaxID=1871086 RepID=UPI001A1926F2|nr:phage tail length tape measure family protein [Brevundimonas sp.]MBJ7446852.1 phage tail length tape measure family protein [Brevundimonas sp.]